jgi:hypothetical protein
MRTKGAMRSIARDPSRHKPGGNPVMQRSPPLCFRLGRRHRRGFSSVSPRFRTIQVCPKDFPAMPRQSEVAVPATFVGGLTMSERVVDEGQSWASDIIGVVSGVGLYSVLFCLVTVLCLYFPA